MSSSAPRLSFGLFVYNAEAAVGPCLDSILAQDFADLEVVVSDNASTDRTREVVEERAARDRRVRLFVNEENVGLVENANRSFQRARGEYFRWVGADDWFEPAYAARCVAALDAAPLAVGASTDFRIHPDQGGVVEEAYRGARVDCQRPEQRFARMLWLLVQSDAWFDPLYSLLRSAPLRRTGLHRLMLHEDLVLAAELSLLGPFVHVPGFLYNRRRTYASLADRNALYRRYHPTRWREVPTSPLRLARTLDALVAAQPLDAAARRRCRGAIALFVLRQSRRVYRNRLNHFRRERLGLTRARLRSLLGG
jgi:glycosyltransferase involved in cell wall biosynthesis